MEDFNNLVVEIGQSFYIYGISTGVIFSVSLFFFVFFCLNLFIRKRYHVARVFLYGAIAHLCYTLFNTYGLLYHFEPARYAFPEWVIFLGKMGIPIGLYMNFKVIMQTTPIQSEEAFALWHKSKPAFLAIDVLYLITLTAIAFIDSYQIVMILGFGIALIHCISGAIFSSKVVQPQHVGKMYSVAMFSLSVIFAVVLLLIMLKEPNEISNSVFFAIHGIASLLIMLCGFALITFIIETNLSHKEVSTFNIENLDKNIFHAIRNDEFFVVYQPKINIKTKKVTGLEALIRWQHPKKGLIMPGQFIPMLEKTPIINDICHFMIDKVSEEMIAFKENKLNVPVSINFSVNNLNKDTANHLIKTIHDKKLTSNCLMVEITESLFLDMDEEQKNCLTVLKDAGIRLSLDDFGAGFSSLRHLDKLGLTELKLDKGITDNIHDATNRTVLANLINMCHDLGIKVVAEGVEDKATLKLLAKIKCFNIQGFYICKPKTQADLLDWYANSTKPKSQLRVVKDVSQKAG